MSYATRGSGPASTTNELQDSGQYFGDKERRLLRSEPGKARGKASKKAAAAAAAAAGEDDDISVISAGV